MDQALHSLDNDVKPRVMQTSPFRPPLAELPLVNHAPEAAPTSTGLGSIGVPRKIEQTTNLFAAAISPPGARPRPCSPVYSGGDTILGDGGVQIFKAEESHSSSVNADGCSVQKNLVSVNFSKWRFKSSRSSL
ncbi:unnamed protein product [Dibothriocephalus latus]|uniref:Uncharacterized protein n=1 Tax=Dibothriocephalus latus TaxID=60516 RepID=A0A3P7MY99_DIBLA|nr:unnamed protein product [Dibothriocephalus latus]